MQYFDVGPEGMDIGEFNHKVQQLMKGAGMEIEVKDVLAKLGLLVMENDLLKAKLAECQSLLEASTNGQSDDSVAVEGRSEDGG